MKTIWKNEVEADGAILTEQEANILWRLAQQLSHKEKIDKGFTLEEAEIISSWGQSDVGI